MSSFGLCILAAGKGTRMKTQIPKALAPLLGKKLVDFSILCLRDFAALEKAKYTIGVVTGHLREEVEGYIANNYNLAQEKIEFTVQEQQLGTADALKAYFKVSEAKSFEYTVVMCADTPLIEASDLSLMFEEFKKNPKINAVCATFKADEPKGYGRIVRGNLGFHIVEEKDASDTERKITEVNSGMYIFKTSYILEKLSNISDKNKSKEFYLTDAFSDSEMVTPLLFPNGEKFTGVNTLTQLDDVTSTLRDRKLRSLQENGVFILDRFHTYLDWEVTVEPEAVLHPNIYLYGKTKIGTGVTIEPGTIIKSSTVEAGANILAHSYLEDAIIRQKADIGPFARVRPGSDVGEKSKIGNFVELKKAKLEKGVKISHLSYVGDAFIGEDTNIGCGFITCNYDGANKHITKIGKNTFIGSDCQAVAPIEIGSNAFVAAGTTITKDVPTEGFAIARATITVKENMAKRFIKKKEK